MKKRKLVFATNNANKINEVKALLEACGPDVSERYEVLSLQDIGCTEDIPENSSTFAGNALQKAEYVNVHYDVDCFADDSGLEVRALGMDPGVRSARYAQDEGYDHNSEANNDKLLRKLKRVRDRSAQFRTVIVLLMDGKMMEFEGVCRGEITKERAGREGFGYDPIFRPNGYDITFAEMTMEEKNAISHRGKAVRALVEYLKEQ
ncbi:MAG: RdgB/HAM1 family non-canonical purine NTP pyrophosphatase [Bacteroidales bacterium]|jgi:XTP/dITP diphosphohydrolase|nr:RdgB/HAM1 family non-canonical purine NTP pyrophosphatase [Bacteroidales bacterium]